ncbi:MAG: hypothetical protein K5790_04855 [Nitrosopumilus sp.]|uniref:hypothetical protein n=1 Tax=Nitrosopumilus sp. TaxID=2024843 RepID=UPI00247DFFBA|nr:hypothetical protein [Nitrosopumilus sp.]MCV0392609.1 hypothetical protein [Nitrosopumilus sp.]
MKVGNLPIIVGTIIGIMGIIFHLQGYGVVGPETSFMYHNPDWISYGMQIAIVGVIIIGTGIGISYYKKSS